MWSRLGIGNFISKILVNNDSCDIFVCDLTRIWHKSLTNDELFSISQRLNPLFETSLQKLRELTLNLFEDEKVQKEIKEENDTLCLKLESSKLGVKFQFQVILNRGNEEMLYKEFTIPLLATIVCSQNREKSLIKIIKEKDAEIQEYQQEYPALKSSYLATKPFSENEFYSRESMNAQSLNFSPSALLDCIHKKLVCMEKSARVKEEDEPSQEKTEKHHLKSENKCDTEKLIFKDKNSGHSSKVNVSIKPDHRVVKRRKKENELCKIKF